MAKEESIDDILVELRYGAPPHDVSAYLLALADRIELAHTSGVIRAMEELMGK